MYMCVMLKTKPTDSCMVSMLSIINLHPISWLHECFVFIVVLIFGTGSFYIALAGLVVSTKMKLIPNSVRSIYLCLLSAEIKGYLSQF